MAMKWYVVHTYSGHEPRISFEETETVRVIDGPFANFTGTVVEVKPEKQKVRVNVSIFGRATPVALDFAQVEKSYPAEQRFISSDCRREYVSPRKERT